MVVIFRNDDDGNSGVADTKKHPYFTKPVKAPRELTASSILTNSLNLSFVRNSYKDATYIITSNDGSINRRSDDETINVSGLTPGKSYIFYVTAESKRNNTSDISAPSITYTTAPVAPTINSVSITGQTSASVSFTSTNGPDTTYSVTTTPATITLTPASGTSTVYFTTLTSGLSYRFTITATSASGSASVTSASYNTASSVTFTVANGVIDPSWNFAADCFLQDNTMESTLRTGSSGNWKLLNNSNCYINLSKFGITSLLDKTITLDVYAPYYMGQGYSNPRLAFYFGASSQSNGCCYYFPMGAAPYSYIGINETTWGQAPRPYRNFPAASKPDDGYIPGSLMQQDRWVKMCLKIDSAGNVYPGRNDMYFVKRDLSSNIVGTLVGFNNMYTYYIDNFSVTPGGSFPMPTVLYSLLDGSTTGWTNTIASNSNTSNLFYPHAMDSSGCLSIASSTYTSFTTLSSSYNISSFLNKTIQFDYWPIGCQNSFYFGGSTTSNGVSVCIATDQINAGVCANSSSTTVTSPGASPLSLLSIGYSSWGRVKITITSAGVVTLLVNGSIISSATLLSSITGTNMGFIANRNGAFYIDKLTIFEGVN